MKVKRYIQMTGRSVLAKLNQMAGAELDRPIQEILAELDDARSVEALLEALLAIAEKECAKS